MFKHDHWVKPDLKRYRWLLFWSLTLGILTFVCAGALMFTSGYLIDFSARQPLFAAIYVPVVLTRAFGIGRPVFQYLERLTSHNWVLRVTSHMRRKLYQVLETDAAFWQEHRRTGDLLSLLADDIGHIQNLYLRAIFPTVVAGGLSLLITLGLGIFDWGFALWILLLLLIQLILIPWWGLLVEKKRKQRQKALTQQAYGDLTDATLGLSDWTITHHEQAFLQQATQAATALAASTHTSRKFQWWRDFCGDLAFGLIPAALLWWSAARFGSGQVTANWIGSFALVMFPLAMAFSSVAQGVGEWPTYQGALQHLNDLTPSQRPLPAQLAAPTQVKALTLSGVHFRYNDAAPELISGVDLTMKRGEKIALLGPSGMGKTTLLQLVLGDLTATSGQVLLDGQSVLQYQSVLPQLFAVLDQSPFLFNTSVANNVRLGNETATDDEVWAALKAVQLDQLVASLPQGADTPVEEAGFAFSGGQRQRLALARILLQDAPIVLLDEPTVGLDPITEQALVATMFAVLKDKTVLWVTHHLQGVDRCDQVLFLEDGHLTLQGRPQELLATSARYRHLYALDAGEI